MTEMASDMFPSLGDESRASLPIDEQVRSSTVAENIARESLLRDRKRLLRLASYERRPPEGFFSPRTIAQSQAVFSTRRGDDLPTLASPRRHSDASTRPHTASPKRDVANDGDMELQRGIAPQRDATPNLERSLVLTASPQYPRATRLASPQGVRKGTRESSELKRGERPATQMARRQSARTRLLTHDRITPQMEFECRRNPWLPEAGVKKEARTSSWSLRRHHGVDIERRQSFGDFHTKRLVRLKNAAAR